ncbi:sigma-E processing peptidase SpoIIGA [Clostridiales bacterium oral taxon 876 str. F0540]|nr:sigma-E processing peptidase SpoIIGA [Clostridiales bacterium oral taxon 876 str. F0540]
MVVNLDVLILENALIDYFLLYITVQTIRIKIKSTKLILPSVIGGSYVVTIIFPKLNFLTLLPFKILIVFIMISMIYKLKNLVLILKASVIFLLYSMLLEGLCFFVELNGGSTLNDLSSLKLNFTYKKLMLVFIVCYLLINRLIIYIKDRKDISTLIYKVDIKSNNIYKTFFAFLDTGNELREPATNLPVLILENKYISDFNIRDNDKLYIPYKVVNGNVGRLVGFKPEYINIHIKDKVTQREVIVAFCEDKLSELNDYQALLSRGII